MTIIGLAITDSGFQESDFYVALYSCSWHLKHVYMTSQSKFKSVALKVELKISDY